MHKKLCCSYWLLLRCFFVPSIFDHYSLVYRMCLTKKKTKQNFVITRRRRRARHY